MFIIDVPLVRMVEITQVREETARAQKIIGRLTCTRMMEGVTSRVIKPDGTNDCWLQARIQAHATRFWTGVNAPSFFKSSASTEKRISASFLDAKIDQILSLDKTDQAETCKNR